MELPNGVKASQWRKVRKVVLAHSTICHLCGRDLVPDALPRSRWSTEVDHRIPLRAVRHLDLDIQRAHALDPTNLVAAHKGCNSAKRDHAVDGVPAGATSRNW